MDKIILNDFFLILKTMISEMVNTPLIFVAGSVKFTAIINNFLVIMHFYQF